MIAPVTVDVANLEGTTVDVQEGNFIYVNVPKDSEALWTATIADEMILSFSPGGTDGSSVSTPGFNALAVGTTKVTMTDGMTTVNFTANVTGK